MVEPTRAASQPPTVPRRRRAARSHLELVQSEANLQSHRRRSHVVPAAELCLSLGHRQLRYLHLTIAVLADSELWLANEVGPFDRVPEPAFESPDWCGQEKLCEDRRSRKRRLAQSLPQQPQRQQASSGFQSTTTTASIVAASTVSLSGAKKSAALSSRSGNAAATACTGALSSASASSSSSTSPRKRLVLSLPVAEVPRQVVTVC